MTSMLVVNPAVGSPGYYTSQAYAGPNGGITQVADLAIVTVAALAPSHWTVRVVDEDLEPADLDDPADFIAITGKVSQRSRMIELAKEYRRRGRTVLIGGSFASLSPDEMRPHADILVTGELEELAAQLFADLEAGSWRPHYDGGKADLRFAPTPRWDLYPKERALAGALQTSRGCPFSCEFCDVIQYQGRKQRFKDIYRILAEMDVLYDHGFRNVFLVDDNFTVARRRAREVLEAISGWNAAHADDPIHFLTQASMDIARDGELLTLAREAGVRTLFMGIETINEASLKGASKPQNLLLPIAESIDRVVSRGLAIQAGVIVGFDQDGPDIFERLADFFDATPLPDLSIGVLTAPAATDLHQRLKSAGRLTGEVWETTAGTPFETNIIPLGMTHQALLEGASWLASELYAPAAYGRRMRRLIDTYVAPPAISPLRAGKRFRSNPALSSIRRAMARGPAEAKMIADVLRYASGKREVLPSVVHFLGRYEQARLVVDRSQQALAFGGEKNVGDGGLSLPPALVPAVVA